MTAYPAALDSIASPTGTTTQDQVGFLHAELHALKGDAIEALEAKVGTGASTPTANKVLGADGTGTSSWRQIVSADLAANAVSKRQLDYASSTDLHSSPTAVSATTWTDVIANQSFTTDAANSVVEVTVGGNIYIAAGGANTGYACRVVIDSSGSPQAAQNKQISGRWEAPSGGLANPLNGAGPVKFTNLVAGTHTVKLQVYATAAASMYLRSATQPTIEFVNIQVTELKR